MIDHVSGEDLAAYLDGRLDADKKNALESHFSRCPECLDELVQVASILPSRDKIPAGFLTKALGEKKRVPKPVLHLRLVFEVAAALVVVVFIGYMFLNDNRFWRTPEGQESSILTENDVPPAETVVSVPDRKIVRLPAQKPERTAAKKSYDEPVQAESDRQLADSLAAENRENAFAAKGASTASSKPAPILASGNKMPGGADELPRPVGEGDGFRKNELSRPATIADAGEGTRADFADKDKPAAKAAEKKVDMSEPGLERQKEPIAGAALPTAAKIEKLKEEESLLKSSVAISAAAGAAEPADTVKKQEVALARKYIADKKTPPPVRVEGDAVWTDLRNPELFSSWSWFKKGLILELRIDDAGRVTAVVAMGKVDPLVARQAESEAKKLLFSVSEKKSRRVRLLANESPPT